MSQDIKRESYIKNIAKNVRKKILDISLAAGSSSAHIGGALSSVEIISSLYAYYIKYDTKNPLMETRDRFILSKGHGCLSYYSILSEIGYIPYEDLLTFEKTGSYLLGHPTINKERGIEFSNGSLGMGLSLGIGVALSLKRKKLSNHIYVLIGDGECNEGSVWESIMCASSLNLDNITIIIDKNNFQQTGSTNEILINDQLQDKLKGFNWNVIDLDGHDILSLLDALDKKFDNLKPKAIVANTIKGKGFSFVENDNSWHHAVLTQKQYDAAIQELNES